MTRKDATKSMLNFLKNLGFYVIPITLTTGATKFLFSGNKVAVFIAALGTAFVEYMVWIEFRIRKIEEVQDGSEKK